MSKAYLASAAAAAAASILAVIKFNMEKDQNKTSSSEERRISTPPTSKRNIETPVLPKPPSSHQPVVQHLTKVAKKPTTGTKFVKWLAIGASMSFITALTYVAYRRYRHYQYLSTKNLSDNHAKHSESRIYKISSADQKWVISEETLTLRDGTSCNLLREVHTNSQSDESKRSTVDHSIQLSGASGFGLSRYQWRMSTIQDSPENTPPKSSPSSQNSTMTPTRATPLRVRLRESPSSTTPSPSSSGYNRGSNTTTTTSTNNKKPRKNKRRVAINTLTPIRTVMDSK